MPKQIDPEAPLKEVRKEIIFTRSAIEAEEDVADLAGLTQGWEDPITGLEAQAWDNEVVRIQLDAQFEVINGNLDDVCTAFSEVALKAAGGDRKDVRFTRYFAVPPSDFIRQALPVQVLAVKGWLSTQDAVLVDFRAQLQKWVTAAEAWAVREAAAEQSTASLTIARQDFAGALTEKRDALHEQLAARGRDRKRRRGFADRFFRRG